MSRWLWLICTLLVATASAQPRVVATKPTLEEALKAIAPMPAEVCGLPSSLDLQDEKGDFETAVFQAADRALLDSLSPTVNQSLAKEKLKHALAASEILSDELLKTWPAEQRLRGKVIEAGQLLLVSFTLRDDSTYVAFGLGKAGTANSWLEVGSDYERSEAYVASRAVNLFPLHSAPGGSGRFLAAIGVFGCAGSTGIRYRVYQWSGTQGEQLNQVLSQDGAFGLEYGADGTAPTVKAPFHPIGMLRTTGTRLTLPFCWFSGLDTWDNPSMCAEDRYDLRGDAPNWVARTYNRPDLLPIAKVIEYTSSHDIPAASAYCAARGIAERVRRDAHWGDDLRVKYLGSGLERVTLADTAVFTVKRTGHRWLITDYRTK